MADGKHTASGRALTELVLKLFQLNNQLLTAGDRLVAGIGLTSARWKILGTIAAEDRPRPVAWLARDLGGNRQNVQRIVNDLASEGLVGFESNPHHRRAQLVVLTPAGRAVLEQAMRRQTPWINELAQGLKVADIDATRRVITALSERLTVDPDD